MAARTGEVADEKESSRFIEIIFGGYGGRHLNDL
jgi:hypothetical protein